MRDDDTGRAQVHDDAEQSMAYGFPPSRPHSSILGAAQTDSSANLTAPVTATDALLPPDTGFAWTFLAASFTCETLCWGFPFAIGVFHEYWITSLFPDASATTLLALAATLQTGLMYMSAAVLGPLFQRYPSHRRTLQYMGLLISVAGVLGSAFVSAPWHLVITAGVLYPIGGGLYYLPAATLLFEWFQRKRGFAGGVMYSGTGFGGAVFPYIMYALLRNFSYKTAVLSLAIGYGTFGAIALYFIRERIPVPRYRQEGRRYRIPTSFFRKQTFYAFCGCILLTSFGNFLPAVYLPSYARDIGLSDDKGTLLVAMMNAASIVGLLVFGHLSDRLPTRVVVSLNCLGASASCLLLWGFATSLSVLVIFAILFGFFALSFAALWTNLTSLVAGEDHLVAPIVFSLFAFSRGVGNVCSGLIGDALLKHGGLRHVRYAYGVENYGGLLLYIGGVIALGSVVGVSYRIKQD